MIILPLSLTRESFSFADSIHGYLVYKLIIDELYCILLGYIP